MSCMHCGGDTPYKGRGRPRKFCSKQCTNRYWSNEHHRQRQARKGKVVGRSYKKPRHLLQKNLLKARDLMLRDAEMMLRGRCATHLQLFGHELLVTEHNKAVFQFDHLDRRSKVGIVSRIIGRHADQSVLTDEMAKCQLVCANCHQLKTKVMRDFVPLDMASPQTHPQLELQ